jgi:ribosomal protein L29
MKRNDLAEVKKTDIDILKTRAKKTKGEIADLVLDKNMDKMSNLRAIKNKRRDLAQIMTVLRQKQLLKELEKPSVKAAEDKKNG